MSPQQEVCVDCGRGYVVGADERPWRDRGGERLCVGCQVAAAHEYRLEPRRSRPQG